MLLHEGPSAQRGAERDAQSAGRSSADGERGVMGECCFLSLCGVHWELCGWQVMMNQNWGHSPGPSTVPSPFWKQADADCLAGHGSQQASDSWGLALCLVHGNSSCLFPCPKDTSPGCSHVLDGWCVNTSPLPVYLLPVSASVFHPQICGCPCTFTSSVHVPLLGGLCFYLRNAFPWSHSIAEILTPQVSAVPGTKCFLKVPACTDHLLCAAIVLGTDIHISRNFPNNRTGED